MSFKRPPGATANNIEDDSASGLSNSNSSKTEYENKFIERLDSPKQEDGIESQGHQEHSQNQDHCHEDQEKENDGKAVGSSQNETYSRKTSSENNISSLIHKISCGSEAGCPPATPTTAATTTSPGMSSTPGASTTPTLPEMHSRRASEPKYPQQLTPGQTQGHITGSQQIQPTSSQQANQPSSRQTHTAFIHKLYQMLEDPSMAHLIWWSKTNDSFVLVPCEEFAKALSQYFKHTNISSFVRQLNMYGFHKVNESFPGYQADSSQWEFRHGAGSFKRGDLESLKGIKRRASSKNVAGSSSITTMPAGRQPQPTGAVSTPLPLATPITTPSGAPSSSSLAGSAVPTPPTAPSTTLSLKAPGPGSLSLSSSSASSGAGLVSSGGPRTSYFSGLSNISEAATHDGTTSKFAPIQPKDQYKHHLTGPAPRAQISAQALGQSSSPPGPVSGVTPIAPSPSQSLEQRIAMLEQQIWHLTETNARLQKHIAIVCDVLRRTHSDLPKILEFLMQQQEERDKTQEQGGTSGTPVQLPQFSSSAPHTPLPGSGDQKHQYLLPPKQLTPPALSTLRQSLYATSLVLSHLDDAPAIAFPIAHTSHPRSRTPSLIFDPLAQQPQHQQTSGIASAPPVATTSGIVSSPSQHLGHAPHPAGMSGPGAIQVPPAPASAPPPPPPPHPPMHGPSPGAPTTGSQRNTNPNYLFREQRFGSFPMTGQRVHNTASSSTSILSSPLRENNTWRRHTAGDVAHRLSVSLPSVTPPGPPPAGSVHSLLNPDDSFTAKRRRR